jgi:hypothetical protein
MVIELRKAAQDKAFELLDEIKDLGHQKKMVLCELEDALYECFESSEEEYEDYEKDPEMEFRRRRSYKYGMRKHDREYDDDDYEGVQYRRGMRMRRSRRTA